MSTLYLYFGVSFIFSALTIKDFTTGSHHEASSVMLSIQLLGKQNVYANIGLLLGKGECFTFSYGAFHCNLSLILSRRHPCAHEGKKWFWFCFQFSVLLSLQVSMTYASMFAVCHQRQKSRQKQNKQKKMCHFPKVLHSFCHLIFLLSTSFNSLGF